MKAECQGQRCYEIRACGERLTFFVVGTKIEERIKVLINIQKSCIWQKVQLTRKYLKEPLGHFPSLSFGTKPNILTGLVATRLN